mmetsp:Transcript_76511/g.211328  ORF Transcript_76511/g.211328 Transcript_76511/m.211328 type:complete len:238 (+) Transcript_76511:1099-1812(+)
MPHLQATLLLMTPRHWHVAPAAPLPPRMCPHAEQANPLPPVVSSQGARAAPLSSGVNPRVEQATPLPLAVSPHVEPATPLPQGANPPLRQPILWECRMAVQKNPPPPPPPPLAPLAPPVTPGHVECQKALQSLLLRRSLTDALPGEAAASPQQRFAELSPLPSPSLKPKRSRTRCDPPLVALGLPLPARLHSCQPRTRIRSHRLHHQSQMASLLAGRAPQAIGFASMHMPGSTIRQH